MKNIRLAIVTTALAGALAFPAISSVADDHGNFHIPPGHMPPPGKCRIWYPGTPPGHQPPPGDCRVLSRQLPNGAWLVSRERVWSYRDRPDYYYHRPYGRYGRPDWRDDHRYPGVDYDAHRYSDRSGVRDDMKNVRDARKNVRDNRDQLEKNAAELKKDRAELHHDIRNRAGQKEIRQDRQELRDDAQKISANKKDLRQSQNKLDAAHRDLRQDLRTR